MEIVLAGINGAFVLVMTLVLTWYVQDRFGEVKQELEEVRSEVRDLRSETRSDLAGLRGEFREEIAGLRGEFREETAGLRSDLLAIALAVGAQPRPNTA